MQNDVAVSLTEPLERRVDVEAVVLGEGRQHVKVVDVAPVPAADGSLGQAGLGVQDDSRRVEILLDAQTITAGAGTGGIVERKQAGFQLVDTVAAFGAGEARGKHNVGFFFVHVADCGEAIGQLQGGLEGFGQAQAEVFPDLEAVDHDIDRVLLFLVQIRQIVEIADATVDARPHETRGAQLLEDLLVFSLAPAHDRGQQHELTALRHGQDAVDHLADRLCLQRDVVLRAAWLTDSGEQQTQIIVDFRDRAHGGSRVVRGGFLLDGNSR